MNANNKKIIILSSLIVIEIIIVFLMVCSLNPKTLLGKIDSDSKEILRNSLAIMVEQDDGNYTNQTSLPSKEDGYIFNTDRSGCINSTGNIIENAITYDKKTNSVTVESDVSLGCYLYFDLPEIATEYILTNASEADLWDSPLEDDGYRYVGTNPDNYVCFGYEDEETDCDFTKAENTDLYAYRVIGIFEDEQGVEHVKLIKKEAITEYPFTIGDSGFSETYTWQDSELYRSINGESFLTNTDYSYMQNEAWINRIATWNYTETNTLSYLNEGALDYKTSTAQNIYLHEMNRSTKTNTVGEWSTLTSKISLMYVSDSMLSLGSGALTYTSSANSEILRTGWMHFENNDIGTFDDGRDSEYRIDDEWTMTISGWYEKLLFESSLIAIGGFCDEDGVGIGDEIYNNYIEDLYGAMSEAQVRPVFYLTSDTTMSGDGTIESPFIIYK